MVGRHLWHLYQVPVLRGTSWVCCWDNITTRFSFSVFTVVLSVVDVINVCCYSSLSPSVWSPIEVCCQANNYISLDVVILRPWDACEPPELQTYSSGQPFLTGVSHEGQHPVKNMSPWGLDSELSPWPAANWGRRCPNQEELHSSHCFVSEGKGDWSWEEQLNVVGRNYMSFIIR